jgi:hypothetical protein
MLVRQGLQRPDVVVAGKQIAGVVLTLDRREPLIGLRWINRGDILLGGRSEEVCVGAIDVRCESPPDRVQGRTSHPLRLSPVPVPHRPQPPARPLPVVDPQGRSQDRHPQPAQLKQYRPLFDNTKRLRELISELETLSAEVVEQAEGWTAT